MKHNPTKHVQINEGDVLTFDTLTWDDGWEFECPSMLLSPVIRCFETGARHESIVEDVLIDAVCDKDSLMHCDDFEGQWSWRGYKLPVLRRRFKEALAGKFFPIANYQAERSTVLITRDTDGELTWVAHPTTT